MFLFPFLEKSKKLLKWTGEHLTTPVNLDEHGATRNMKKAWRIATFLYIGEHRWQMFNGSPKRKAAGSNPARDASQQRGRWKISRFFLIGLDVIQNHRTFCESEKTSQNDFWLKMAHVFAGVSGCKSVINRPYCCRNPEYDTRNCYVWRKRP